MALNSLVLGYTLICYGVGMGLIAQSGWILNLIGVLLLIHTMVFAAVLVHEFIHGTIFKGRSPNALWGKIMAHLCGTWYVPYEVLVSNHFHHHVHHVDLVPFDYEKYVRALPRWVQELLVTLEWAYIPAFDLLLRWRYVIEPFQHPEKQAQRGRILMMLAYRGVVFGLLGWVSLKALLLYAIAYVGFLQMFRFVETFHHTYDYAVVGESFPSRDRAYEDANTFSNVLTGEHLAWLNLLYLNFGYHNAHHHDMRCPWHRLPQLHHQIYGTQAKNLLTIPRMMSNYHRFRVDRIFSSQGDIVSENGSLNLNDFSGAVGVSLLTPP
jgi:fatty acid desaturase